MYKVLLVDDEKSIREGLQTLIPWEEYGFQVIGTAANGREALELHQQHAPQLMLVDIRMPGMSGLELIAALREKDEAMHILILSGYADFDYAKQAMSKRVDGYLLKPVDEDELMGYLGGLAKKIATEAEERERLSQAEEDHLEKRIVYQLTRGGNAASAPPDEGPGWNTYEVVLIKLLSVRDIDTAVTALIKYDLAMRIEQSGRGAVFAVEGFIGILLKDTLNSEHHRTATYDKVREACAGMKLDFIAVAGGEVSHWADLTTSYAMALNLMQDRFFYESGRIIRESDQRQRAEDAAAPDLGDIGDRLYLAVDIGNCEAVETLVREAGKAMVRAGLSEQAVKTQFVQLSTMLLKKRASDDPEFEAISQRFSSEMLEMYREYRLSDLLAHAIRWFDSLAQASQGRGGEDQIKRMIDVIQRNYHENLKLETLAEMFGYNSAYLGKLFKSTTGEYFNTYLDKVRIERAKVLLEGGDKVYQVAEKVGYASVDYFHSKFKKYVGVSPTTYRKK